VMAHNCRVIVTGVAAQQVLDELRRLLKIDAAVLKRLADGHAVPVCECIGEKEACANRDELEAMGCQVRIEREDGAVLYETDNAVGASSCPQAADADVICPKCGYRRTGKDEDICPDSMCPACGVVYAKAHLAQQRAAAVSEPHPEVEAVSAARPGRRWSKKMLALVAVVVLVIIGQAITVYIDHSFDRRLRDVEISLMFDTQEQFNQALDQLIDLMEFTASTVYRYRHLPADSVARYVLQTIAVSDDFLKALHEKAAAAAGDGKQIYGYAVYDVEKDVRSNQHLLLYIRKNEEAQKRLAVFIALRTGVTRSGGSSKKILRPLPIAEKQRQYESRRRCQRAKDDENARIRYAMEMAAMRRACDNGNKLACEALDDMRHVGRKGRR